MPATQVDPSTAPTQPSLRALPDFAPGGKTIADLRAIDARSARYLHAPGRSPLGPALPSVDDYLALLPDGLASYPLVATTGVTVRRLVEDPLHALSAGSGLPPALAEHVLHPPGARAWVPVVHLVALHAALYDLDFSGRDGREGYAEWVFRRNVDLLRTPALRTIASVASPVTMVRLFLLRWRSLYRGLTAEVQQVTSREATVRFAYPPHCWTGLSHVAMTGVLRAVLVVSGGEEASVEVEVESVRGARFTLRWR